MAQTDSKVLILGALAGVAGIGLAVVCYRSLRSKRRASCPGFFQNRADEPGSALAVVDGPGLTRGQAEVLERLEALIQCVSELKEEMKALKTALPAPPHPVREERAGAQHRTTVTRRKRAAASATRREGQSSEDAESEGGYLTALTDTEEEEESDEEPTQDNLFVLLERIDRLRQGDESDKRESLNILLEQRDEFGHSSEFLWRLTRAYCDVHDVSVTLEEKKAHAENGKQVGEEAINVNPKCAESHQWYAIMCGILAEYDTIQNKIRNGYVFKDHLDKAIELKPHDPLSYYLLGRWCYAVAQLSWIERKVAATLFGEPPSASIEDALKNFLKVEEIHPAYSKLNYVFLAKCYKALGQTDTARKMCEAASSMRTVSKEDEEAQKELDLLFPALGV
ncbi:regulator of microtubule dynamics protein 2 [Fundulus heteroclitus]|uniref:regulator of microtubule dynamics protein 2 n=1 Tax=Fundulus heteroclitus TaxID=8078 RepID=UPI00165CD883|nr:regulator of microtubule dynamics protein 2 [Fundulus heteroclitus]XP_035982616.1 regulator of microtubule dynamics protein 2 [Fundulus heteroclitus]